MDCKECGKSIAEGEGQAVADWHFCKDCFAQLMSKPSPTREPEPKPEPKIDLQAALAGVKGASSSCESCGCDVAEGAGRKLGPILFCEKCFSNLTAMPPEPEPVAEEPEEDDGIEIPVDLAGNRIASAQETIKCAGCKRQIRAIAAKEFKEQKLCPDCWYALPEEDRDA